MSKYLEVSTWTEAELSLVPTKETDEYEYKSSKSYSSTDELKLKIQKAASAFWNSGGGYFIVGYDEKSEKIDGGIPDKVGKKPLREWVDIALHQVEPVGRYEIQVIEPTSTESKILPGNVVLVLGFAESYNLPHMCVDNKYYIRAGAHTEPAKHYIVESLWAKRNISRPILFGNIQPNPLRARIFDFTLLAANNVPAINVRLSMHNLPSQLDRALARFLPLKIPMIDNNNPFRMEFASHSFFSSWFGDESQEIQVELQYQDLAGQEYSDIQTLSPIKTVGPLTFNETEG